MIELKDLQKQAYDNKVKQGFNTTNIEKEFCLTYGELNEAYEAWLKSKDNLGEELADVMIYLLGMAEILGLDLEKEVLAKLEKNSKRKYKTVNGVKIREEGCD